MSDESNYKAREAAVKKMAEGLKGKGKIGSAIATETKRRSDVKDMAKCDLARRVFREGMEMYEEGTMTFKEFVDDLHKTLLAIE